ncbi:MAG: PAS domain-containing sensor histidine kinase [Anditalea sp.]
MALKEKYLSPFDSSLFIKMMFENAEATSILIMDPNGIILDSNKGFQKTFGYSRESLLGKNFSMLFIKEDRMKNLPERELKKVMDTGSANDDNYLLQEDGSHIWVHGESIYAKNEKGQEFVVKVIQEINKEKQLEQELKKKNEEQERIINDRDIFIYTASHDLQSPINNIEGLVNALKEKNRDPAESNILLAMIEKSINRFRNKINELSEIGKEQEKLTIGTEKLHFKDMLKEVLLDLEEEIKNSPTEIISDFSKATTIDFSKKNLKSILQNLVSNSVKFKSPDRKAKVIVETERIKGGYILLKVQDNGLGIKEEDKDKVFRMYEQLHHKKGTGVGMAIVRRIVYNAGGKIELESQIEEGSTFKIYLPAK